MRKESFIRAATGAVSLLVLAAGCATAPAGEPMAAPDLFKLEVAGTPQELQAAIAAGGDLGARDLNDNAALMWAARYYQVPDQIIALIDAGADATVKDNQGRTVFDLAGENPRFKATEALRRPEETSR